MAQAQPRQSTSTHPTGYKQFEYLFRTAAELGIDKQDLKRYEEFINRKLHDLLIRAEAAAKANDRDIIEPMDLPITKGLQECIYHFKTFDEDARPILERITEWPPLDLAMGDATTERLPEIAGGFGVALARTFKIMDPDLKNPRSEHWDRAIRLFDVLQ